MPARERAGPGPRSSSACSPCWRRAAVGLVTARLERLGAGAGRVSSSGAGRRARARRRSSSISACAPTGKQPTCAAPPQLYLRRQALGEAARALRAPRLARGAARAPRSPRWPDGVARPDRAARRAPPAERARPAPPRARPLLGGRAGATWTPGARRATSSRTRPTRSAPASAPPGLRARPAALRAVAMPLERRSLGAARPPARSAARRRATLGPTALLRLALQRLGRPVSASAGLRRSRAGLARTFPRRSSPTPVGLSTRTSPADGVLAARPPRADVPEGRDRPLPPRPAPALAAAT